MKNMNYLVLISFVLLAIGCSEPDIENLDLTMTNAQSSMEQEYEFLNGLDMYKRSVDVQLFELNEHIAELSDAIESGEDELGEELENTQREIERLSIYRELLDTFVRPIGGRVPGPRPPKGCYVANCKGGISLNGVTGIAFPEGTNIEGIEIKNEENESVGQATVLTENEYGNLTMQFEVEEFAGVGTMWVITSIEGSDLGDVIIEIPVSFEE